MAANLAHLDDPERALEKLQECLEKYPTSPQRSALLFGLVWVGLQLRDASLVEESLDRLETEFPEAPQTRAARELVTSSS